MTKINYKIVDGDLPVGVALDVEGALNGTLSFENVGIGPQWVSPESGSLLGEYDEFEQIQDIQLDATTLDGHPISHFSIVNTDNALPWGITLNPQTGLISGTCQELKFEQKLQSLQTNGPEWQTPMGKLGDFDEFQAITLTLVAQPVGSKTIRHYSIPSSYEENTGLPWGLTLNPLTGVISGTSSELRNPGVTPFIPKLPIPDWTTPQGSLGNVKEEETINLQVSATPASGRTMKNYMVIDGGLPWGLDLNFTTGAISGKVFELRLTDDPAFYEPGKDPVIDNAENLGTFAKGAAVSVQLTATLNAGRTLRHFVIQNESLPWGLDMTKNGLISGTVHARNATGTYQISVKVVDSAFVASVRTFTLSIQ